MMRRTGIDKQQSGRSKWRASAFDAGVCGRSLHVSALVYRQRLPAVSNILIDAV